MLMKMIRFLKTLWNNEKVAEIATTLKEEHGKTVPEILNAKKE